MSEIKVFDINQHINRNQVQNEKQPEIQTKKQDYLSFHELWGKVKDNFDAIYESKKLTNEDKEKRLELEYEAMIGNLHAMNYLVDEIRAFLREEHLLNVECPSIYEDLATGCFHEIYGFGSFSKWEKYPNSTDGIIQGKEIWFNLNGEFVRQEETLRDDYHIWEIIRSLQMKNKGLRINESNPEAEFDRDDGTRIKVLVPPRSFKPTIIFRRFIVNKFSFKEQADRNTIPEEDIPLYDLLAKLHLNTIIAGKVQSGKSTMLKTIYAARDPRSVAVLIESSPESYLKRDFPDRLVHDFYSTDGDIRQVIRDALRVPHDYIIAQEVRGIEAEGAISGTERGTRGLLMTYHITNPKNTPRQLSKHITDEFPSRIEKNEIERIAEQLDLGITMTSIKNNEKRVTSVYELYVDEETREPYINYLIKYDKFSDSWQYNSRLSPYLKERLEEYDLEMAKKFIELLQRRAEAHPMIVSQTKFKCH